MCSTTRRSAPISLFDVAGEHEQAIRFLNIGGASQRDFDS
jgi:hypothetical protein